jgi:hypothetical protein
VRDSIIWRARSLPRGKLLRRVFGAVHARDRFWRGTFVAFVRPLRSLYKDPVSAGSHILSYYLSNPLDVERAVTSTPEAFGDLQFDAIRSNAQQIALDLLLGRHGPPLATCAREFEYARMASRDQETLAAEYPVIYQDLLKKRALQDSNGKPVYIDKPQRPQRVRRYKFYPPAKTELECCEAKVTTKS